MTITEQQVKDALLELIDPNTRKDYITGKEARIGSICVFAG